ncbi:MAG: AGE family epimerase/isomerase [Pseudomonas sp.]
MSDSVSFARSPELSAAFAAVQRHFQQVVVPLWQGPGWNCALQLPYEALQAGPLDTPEAAPLEHLDARQHADSVDSTDSANRLSPAGPLAGLALTQLPQPLPPQRYRAMACARQLYLFANLIDTPHAPLARPRAAALFDSLQRHFHDPQHGGWFYSIDAQGQPLDRRKDLYTHAFVIFACAHYRGRLGHIAQADPAVHADHAAHVGQTGLVGEADPATHVDAAAAARVAAVLDQAVNLVLQRFAVGNGNGDDDDDDDDSGLYEACLAQDWSAIASGPLQNPLMHLAEAFLATLAVDPNPRVEAALLQLVAAMQRRFVDRQHGLVLEKPLGAPDNWFEPGHQFEWLYLLETSPLLRGCALHASLQRAWVFAEQHGVVDGAVLARLDVQGQVLDASQRIWAHAEYLRALTLRPQGKAQVQRQLAALQARFLHAGGWHECLAADGRLERRDLPSTTPYHLATCYAGLAAYLA